VARGLGRHRQGRLGPGAAGRSCGAHKTSDSESANSRLVIIAVQASSASSGQSTPLRTNDSSCSGSSLPTVTVAVLQLEEAAGGGNVAVLPFEEEAAEAEVRSACNACVELSERDLRFFPRTR